MSAISTATAPSSTGTLVPYIGPDGGLPEVPLWPVARNGPPATGHRAH